jgi:hypothetical protein
MNRSPETLEYPTATQATPTPSRPRRHRSGIRFSALNAIRRPGFADEQHDEERVSDPEHGGGDAQRPIDAGLAHDCLPNRLMTAFEVAEFIGCH